jgi:hypothetical protein
MVQYKKEVMGDSKILLSKTPLRISLFGGRTDLSNFYK